jgi:DNA-binding NarL/FixJ family response regulator
MASESVAQERRARIRIVIADDHRLVLSGLRAALADAEGIEIVGEATTGRAAVKTVVARQPDVCLLDLRMPDGDGFWALREIRREAPNTRVVVLSMHDDPQHVNQALADGACGYIVKSIEPGELASAIRHTVDGTVFTSAGAPSSLRSTSQDSPQRLITERELEILQYVAEGLSNSQIGKQLWVTEQTVKFHLSNIYRKLNVSNRTEASRIAHATGLIEPAGVVDTEEHAVEAAHPGDEPGTSTE